MGGVKMINHRGKNSSKRSVSLKFKFHPIKKQKSRAKISPKNQLAQGLVYTVQFRLLLAEKNEMRKGKRNLWSEKS